MQGFAVQVQGIPVDGEKTTQECIEMPEKLTTIRLRGEQLDRHCLCAARKLASMIRNKKIGALELHRADREIQFKAQCDHRDGFRFCTQAGQRSGPRARQRQVVGTIPRRPDDNQGSL
jgi:hypothetical protein